MVRRSTLGNFSISDKLHKLDFFSSLRALISGGTLKRNSTFSLSKPLMILSFNRHDADSDFSKLIGLPDRLWSRRKLMRAHLTVAVNISTEIEVNGRRSLPFRTEHAVIICSIREVDDDITSILNCLHFWPDDGPSVDKATCSVYPHTIQKLFLLLVIATEFSWQRKALVH